MTTALVSEMSIFLLKFGFAYGHFWLSLAHRFYSILRGLRSSCYRWPLYLPTLEEENSSNWWVSLYFKEVFWIHSQCHLCKTLLLQSLPALRQSTCKLKLNMIHVSLLKISETWECIFMPGPSTRIRTVLKPLTTASLKWRLGAWSIQGLPLLAASP